MFISSDRIDLCSQPLLDILVTRHERQMPEDCDWTWFAAGQHKIFHGVAQLFTVEIFAFSRDELTCQNSFQLFQTEFLPRFLSTISNRSFCRLIMSLNSRRCFGTKRSIGMHSRGVKSTVSFISCSTVSISFSSSELDLSNRRPSTILAITFITLEMIDFFGSNSTPFKPLTWSIKFWTSVWIRDSIRRPLPKPNSLRIFKDSWWYRLKSAL